MPERLNATQLRTVRVVITQENILWLHEEDVPWLVEYMVSELETGGVSQIIKPHRVIGDENRPLSSQACAAYTGQSEGIKIKPITPATEFYKLRWDFEGAWEADILRGPRTATKVACRVNNLTSEKWAHVSGAHQIVAILLLELHMQDLQNELLAQRPPAIVGGSGLLADTVGAGAVAVDVAMKVGFAQRILQGVVMRV